MSLSNPESGQWPILLLTTRFGHCEIVTSWGEHYIWTLTEVKYPNSFVVKRKCLAVEIYIFSGD